MTIDTRTRYQIVWMNRARYKDPKTGKLKINFAKEKYDSLEAAEKDFEKWDQAGYALKIREITESRVESLNFGDLKRTYYSWIPHSAGPSAPRIVRTNARWDLRMHDYQLELARKIRDDLKNHLDIVKCLIEGLEKSDKPNYCILSTDRREKLCTGCGGCA